MTNQNNKILIPKITIPAEEIRETIRLERRWKKFTDTKNYLEKTFPLLREKKLRRKKITNTKNYLEKTLPLLREKKLKIEQSTLSEEIMGKNYSKIKSETLIGTFCKENLNTLITDVGHINYTENYTEDRKNLFQPITESFCDNILVLKILSNKDMTSEKLVNANICGANNSYLRGKFSKYKLMGHGVKAKKPTSVNFNKIPSTIMEIIPSKRMAQIKEQFGKDGGFVILPYKIELADVKLTELLKDLPEILSDIEHNLFFLSDFDITQDFTGIFDKRQMEQYLIDNYNFSFPKDQNLETEHIIVENDNTVGLNCLTWVSNCNKRIKVYNKFVCQMTSPGVNKTFGHHIVNFVNCPDERLRNTFNDSRAKEHGITRLEATIYNFNKYNQNFTPINPLKDCIKVINNAKRFFLKAPFYSVPFSAQWQKICDSLKYSSCMVYEDKLYFCLWANSLTNKITGYNIVLPENSTKRKKIIDFMINAYSFNGLPLNYVEFIREEKEKNVEIKILQKAYIKFGKTLFSQPRTLFSSIPPNINIAEKGLIDTKNCQPFFISKRININSDLKFYNVMEIIPEKSCVTKCFKKIQELEEKKNIIKIKKEFEDSEKLLNKEDARNALKIKIEHETKTKELKKKMQIPWIEMPLDVKFDVYGFTINSTSKFPIVAVYGLLDNCSEYCICYVKGPLKNKLIEFSKSSLINTEGFFPISYTSTRFKTNLIMYYWPKSEPFLKLKVGKQYKHYKGTNFPDISLDSPYVELQDPIEKTTIEKAEKLLHKILMEKFPSMVNTSKCKKIETLEESVYVVNSIEERIFRGKTRYLFTVEGVEENLISNIFMEKEIEEKLTKGELDIKFKFNIKVAQLKTNKNKMMERLVFIAQ